ncbi:MAG: hypothetical protein DME50_16950, partial [Verrucomicrobia bacterium]
MKKQINPTIKAHLIRSAFYVTLLLAVCVIPFALAQRNTPKRSTPVKAKAATAGNAKTATGAPLAAVPSTGAATALDKQTMSKIRQAALAPRRRSGAPASLVGATAQRRRPAMPTSHAGLAAGFPTAPNLSPWNIVANYPFASESVSVSSDGTVAYAVGGFDPNIGPTNAFNMYDPVADTWTPLPNIPGAFYDAPSVYDPTTNRIYVFGGIDASFNPSAVVQIYDVAGGTWVANGTPMPTLSVGLILPLLKPTRPGSTTRLRILGIPRGQTSLFRWVALDTALWARTFTWQVLGTAVWDRTFIIATTLSPMPGHRWRMCLSTSIGRIRLTLAQTPIWSVEATHPFLLALA